MKKKIDIDILLHKVRLGDQQALLELRQLNIRDLNDSSFKKLLPWINLSDKDVEEILKILESELNGDGNSVN